MNERKSVLQVLLTRIRLTNEYVICRVGLWPARAWFLKIDPVWIVSVCVCVCVCVFVCVSTPEGINNHEYI